MATNQRIRIVYILPKYDPAASGHLFHLYELLERAAKELDIFLVIEKAGMCPSGMPFDLYCQKFSFAPLRFMELLFISVRERIRGRRYFYTHYSFFGALASWLVTKIFGGRSYYWNCGMPWLYKRGIIEESAFRFALRYPFFVTGTAGIAKEYQARYGLKDKNIRILPNWINTARFNAATSRKSMREYLGIPEDAKVVLFVHHLSRRKGSDKILPIALRITKAVENVIFFVIGAGPEYNNLASGIQHSALGRNVRLLGEVPNHDIPKYFWAADAFFMPSEEEGFPHVLLEAMASGVPFVASDVGGVREITPPELQEYIVPEGDIGAFSEKIGRLLNLERPAREKIVRSARQRLKQYDLQAVLPMFAGLFVDE